MKPYKRAGLIIFLTVPCVLQPVRAQNTFYARYNPSYSDAGFICPSLDNAFYGVTRHFNGEYIYYYKVDQQGDMIWMRQCPVQTPLIPTSIATLSDSSFAFLAFQGGASGVHMFKVDDDGQIVWERSLDDGSSASFQDLAPTTDGGMMLTGSGCLGADMILHLDADGQLVSQHGHSSFDSPFQRPNAIDMVDDGDNNYSYMGYAFQSGNPYSPLTFFRSDSAGTVYSYREIHFPTGAAHSWTLGEGIARSTSGGHFVGLMTDDPAQDHAILLYLNGQDELEWAKEIGTTNERLYFSALSATSDGGCVITGNNVLDLDPYLYSTYAIKFNGQGEMLWSKAVGDTTVDAWDRLGLQSMAPSADGGFLTVPVRYGTFDLCKVDNAFNGFCHETPFIPVVTDLTTEVLEYTLTPTPITFVGSTGTTIEEPRSHSRLDDCATDGIPDRSTEGSMSLAPNPASDRVLLYVKTDRPRSAEVTFLNSLGSVCSSRRFQAMPEQPIELRTGDLPTGTYVVEVRMQRSLQRSVLVVRH